MNIKNITDQMPMSLWKHKPMQKVQGLTLHYAAGKDVAPQYNNEAQLIAILKSYARWHMQYIPNDSIAYTYVVDKWGNVYQTREIKESYHAANVWGNTKSLGILVPLGSKEKPTDVQLKATFELCDLLRERYRFEKSAIYGHKELSYTPCPGNHIMNALIDYRLNRGDYREDETPLKFIPGWFRVIHNAWATIRIKPTRNSGIILSLPADYPEYIHTAVEGETVNGNNIWYQTQSSYGKGYIHSGALERDD